MAERLQWQGVARDPVAVTSAVHEAVVKAGAWIERSEAFSNLSLSLVLGMSSDDVPGVARALVAVAGFEPNENTAASLALGRAHGPSGGASDVYATLLLIYPRGDGSVSRERPPG